MHKKKNTPDNDFETSGILRCRLLQEPVPCLFPGDMGDGLPWLACWVLVKDLHGDGLHFCLFEDESAFNFLRMRPVRDSIVTLWDASHEKAENCPQALRLFPMESAPYRPRKVLRFVEAVSGELPLPSGEAEAILRDPVSFLNELFSVSVSGILSDADSPGADVLYNEMSYCSAKELLETLKELETETQEKGDKNGTRI